MLLRIFCSLMGIVFSEQMCYNNFAEQIRNQTYKEELPMYTPNEQRYEKMLYNRCGKSGLRLPAVSLGFWQNFGYLDNLANMENMVHTLLRAAKSAAHGF